MVKGTGDIETYDIDLSTLSDYYNGLNFDQMPGNVDTPGQWIYNLADPSSVATPTTCEVP